MQHDISIHSHGHHGMPPGWAYATFGVLAVVRVWAENAEPYTRVVANLAVIASGFTATYAYFGPRIAAWWKRRRHVKA